MNSFRIFLVFCVLILIASLDHFSFRGVITQCLWLGSFWTVLKLTDKLRD